MKTQTLGLSFSSHDTDDKDETKRARHAAPSDVSPAAISVVSDEVTGQDLEQLQGEVTELSAQMTRISECVAGLARLDTEIAETAERLRREVREVATVESATAAPLLAAPSSLLRQLGSSGRVAELFPLSEAR